MPIQKFKREYAKLNKEQREAVDSIEGPVMVIAGPGTGKTTILTLRIANILLKTDTPPSGILALTFTEAGAKAMRNKLREIIGERAFEVPIHTFHGFAASIIAEFAEHFPSASLSRQLTDIEAESLMRSILKEKRFAKMRPLGEPDFYIGKLLNAVSDSKQNAWTPEILESFAREEIERVKNDPSSISTRGATKGQIKGEALKKIEKGERTILLAQVYAEYEKRKREERRMDFDDLIFYLLGALREDKLLLQILQERYLYILVDEHQDTNDAQNLIVENLASFFETPNLFVVGDEKQAIYRFQGASVRNFLSFQEKWSAMKVISLEENYRSHQGILDATFKMIEQNYGEDEHKNLRIKLKAGREATSKTLEILEAPDEATEESKLTDSIKEITEKEPGKTVAVILRRNSDVSRIFSLLEANKIPASAERGANIFSHPVGVLYFSLLEFLADPSSSSSLAATFAGGLWGLDFGRQTESLNLARRGRTEEISEQIPAISDLVKRASTAGAVEYLLLAADLSGFTEIALANPLGTEVWRAIFALAENIASSKEIEDPRQLIGELLSYKKAAEQRTIKVKTGKMDARVSVMTAHGSKGLEFDYVFLPYAVEEAWISKNRGSFFVLPAQAGLPQEKETRDDIRDERRLFYVALTRARKHAVMSYSLQDDLGKMLTPVRFLDELDLAHVSRKTLQKVKENRAPQSKKDVEERKKEEKAEYSKRVLEEEGLSATALNTFLRCPSEFFYRCILKLPEPPTAPMERGIAMHRALENVWRERKLYPEQEWTEEKIEKTITDSVSDYLKNSFLPQFEKEILLSDLSESAPKIARCLEDHFNQKGEIRTEVWIKSRFELAQISIDLNGRIDALLENPNNFSVFDYKTKEGQTLAAIKKEGDYFRQIVFYKMILGADPRRQGKAIKSSIIFLKPNVRGDCPEVEIPIEENDISEVKSQITALLESVWSGDFLDSACSDPDCRFCAMKNL